MTIINNNLKGDSSFNQKPHFSADKDSDSLITKKGSQILLNKQNPSSSQIVNNIPGRIPPSQNTEPSFWDRMLMGTGALVAKTVLSWKSTKTRDINVICSMTRNADDIFNAIKSESPRLQQMLAKKIPALGEFIKAHEETADQVTEELILHILGNLAITDLPETLRQDAINGKALPDAYQLDSEALIQKCFLKVMDVIGPHLNQVDANVGSIDDISAQLFNPLASDLFNLLFPLDDTFRSLIPEKALPEILKAIADGLVAAYTPFKQWTLGIDSDSVNEEQNPIQEELNYYTPLIIEKISDYTIQQDLAFFQKLTGQNDIQEMVEKGVGLFAEQIDLPVEILESFGIAKDSPIVEKVIKAALLQGLSNASKEIFKGKIKKNRAVSTDIALRKTVTYFAEKLRKGFKEADRNGNTLEQFYPGSVSLVTLFLPKFDWLKPIIQRNQEKFLKPIAEAQFLFYNATVKDTTEEDYKQKLRNVLWDYNGVFYSGSFGSSRVPLSNPTKEESITAGLEPTVNEVYLLCDQVLSKLQTMGKDYLGDTTITIKILEGLQKNIDPENQFSNEVLRHLTSALNQIFIGNHREINILGERSHHFMKSMVFKGIVRFLEKVPAALRSPPEELLFKALEIPLAIGVQGLTSIGDDFLQNKPIIRQNVSSQFDSIEDLNERNLEINNKIELEEAAFITKAVAPTVNKWINLFFDAGDDLPLPDSIKGTIEKTLRDQASSLFAKVYTAMTRWIVDQKNAETDLNDLFPSKNPLRMCRLIPHLAVEGIPYAIRENQDHIVTTEIMPRIESLLTNTQNTQSSELLKKLIKGLIHKIGDNESNDFKKLLTFIGVFSETAAIRIIGNVFDRIHKMEEDGINLTSVLEDLMKGNLEIATEHLKGINVAKERASKTVLKREELIQSFKDQGILHSALEDDASKEKFFKRLSLILFDIFKINKESEFPVPDYAKELLYDTLEKITPNILHESCDLIRDASTINSILVSALNQASKEESVSILDRLFSREHKDFKEHLKDLDSKFSDQFQLDLQKELGETVEALVGLQTDRLPKYLVKNKGLKGYAAEAIGQPLRAELRNKKTGAPISLLGMLDGVFGSVSDSVAPSFWENDSLVYLDTTFKGEVKIDDQTGKPIESDVPNLARFFPITEKEKALKTKYDAYQIKKTNKNVPRYLRKLISDQTSQIAIEAFILFWAHLEKEFSQWLVTNIGEQYGEKVYNVLLPVTRWVIKYPLSIALIVFNYSIWLIASQVLKWVLSKEAEEIVKDVNINIHDNVIYKGLELVLTRYADELKKIKNDAVDDPVDLALDTD